MRKKPYSRRNKSASSCLMSHGAPKQAQFAREKRERKHHREAPRSAAPAGSRKHRRILQAYQTQPPETPCGPDDRWSDRAIREAAGGGKERAVVVPDGAAVGRGGARTLRRVCISGGPYRFYTSVSQKPLWIYRYLRTRQACEASRKVQKGK